MKKGQLFVGEPGLVVYRRNDLDNRPCYRPFFHQETRDSEVCLSDDAEWNTKLTPLRTWVWKTLRWSITAIVVILILVIISLF